MLFCRWCGNTIQEGVEDCPFCNNGSTEISEPELLPSSAPPQSDPVQEPIIEQQMHHGQNGIPTEDGLHIVHNGRLIELNRSQDGYHYLADGGWHRMNQPLQNPQPVYQPAPQPVYQPAPQPVYQPTPQYIVEENPEEKSSSIGSIIWLVLILLLIGVKIAVQS